MLVDLPSYRRDNNQLKNTPLVRSGQGKISLRKCPPEIPNAMLDLTKSLPPSQLAQKAYALYEKFRPEIPPGKKG